MNEAELCNVSKKVQEISQSIINCALGNPTPQEISQLNALQCTWTIKAVDRALSPILHPNFNLRQSCKEMIWLQMLLNMRYRCKCAKTQTKLKNAVIRHMAILHGLLEECLTLQATPPESALLSNDAIAQLIDSVNDFERDLYLCNMDANPKVDAVLQKIRGVRKVLQPAVFNSVRLDRFEAPHDDNNPRKKARVEQSSCSATH